MIFRAISWFVGTVAVIYKIATVFIKSPEQKKKDALKEQNVRSDLIDDAVKKATDENNPQDLSRIINDR